MDKPLFDDHSVNGGGESKPDRARILRRYLELIKSLRNTAMEMLHEGLFHEDTEYADGGRECLVLLKSHTESLHQMFPDLGFGDLVLEPPAEGSSPADVARAVARMLPRAAQVLSLVRHAFDEHVECGECQPAMARRLKHVRDRVPGPLGLTGRGLSLSLGHIMPFVSTRVADKFAEKMMKMADQWPVTPGVRELAQEDDSEMMEILRRVEKGEMTPQEAAEWFEELASREEEDGA